MNKELLKKLEELKTRLEEELKKFAEKDKTLKDDWDTRYPEKGEGTGGQALEDAASQVEEYANLLPVEYNLELKLRDVNQAIEKIKKGIYGKCEKCGKEISKERLEIIPEAKICQDCQKIE